jgi:hypothetical protein
MEAEVRRLKIELDVYSKTFVELRKKLVEAEDKQKLAEDSLEAKIAGLQSQAFERASKEVQTTAVDLEESAREQQDYQQKVERIRQELRIQWDLDHKVKIKK